MELLFSDILHNRGTSFKEAILLYCHLVSLNCFLHEHAFYILCIHVLEIMNILSQHYKRAAQKVTCNWHFLNLVSNCSECGTNIFYIISSMQTVTYWVHLQCEV